MLSRSASTTSRLRTGIGIPPALNPPQVPLPDLPTTDPSACSPSRPTSPLLHLIYDHPDAPRADQLAAFRTSSGSSCHTNAGAEDDDSLRGGCHEPPLILHSRRDSHTLPWPDDTDASRSGWELSEDGLGHHQCADRFVSAPCPPQAHWNRANHVNLAAADPSPSLQNGDRENCRNRFASNTATTASQRKEQSILLALQAIIQADVAVKAARDALEGALAAMDCPPWQVHSSAPRNPVSGKANRPRMHTRKCLLYTTNFPSSLSVRLSKGNGGRRSRRKPIQLKRSAPSTGPKVISFMELNSSGSSDISHTQQHHEDLQRNSAGQGEPMTTKKSFDETSRANDLFRGSLSVGDSHQIDRHHSSHRDRDLTVRTPPPTLDLEDCGETSPEIRTISAGSDPPQLSQHDSEEQALCGQKDGCSKHPNGGTPSRSPTLHSPLLDGLGTDGNVIPSHLLDDSGEYLVLASSERVRLVRLEVDDDDDARRGDSDGHWPSDDEQDHSLATKHRSSLGRISEEAERGCEADVEARKTSPFSGEADASSDVRTLVKVRQLSTGHADREGADGSAPKTPLRIERRHPSANDSSLDSISVPLMSNGTTSVLPTPPSTALLASMIQNVMTPGMDSPNLPAGMLSPILSSKQSPCLWQRRLQPFNLSHSPISRRLRSQSSSGVLRSNDHSASLEAYESDCNTVGNASNTSELGRLAQSRWSSSTSNWDVNNSDAGFQLRSDLSRTLALGLSPNHPGKLLDVSTSREEERDGVDCDLESVNHSPATSEHGTKASSQLSGLLREPSISHFPRSRFSSITPSIRNSPFGSESSGGSLSAPHLPRSSVEVDPRPSSAMLPRRSSSRNGSGASSSSSVATVSSSRAEVLGLEQALSRPSMQPSRASLIVGSRADELDLMQALSRPSIQPPRGDYLQLLNESGDAGDDSSLEALSSSLPLDTDSFGRVSSSMKSTSALLDSCATISEHEAQKMSRPLATPRSAYTPVTTPTSWFGRKITRAANAVASMRVSDPNEAGVRTEVITSPGLAAAMQIRGDKQTPRGLEGVVMSSNGDSWKSPQAKPTSKGSRLLDKFDKVRRDGAKRGKGPTEVKAIRLDGSLTQSMPSLRDLDDPTTKGVDGQQYGCVKSPNILPTLFPRSVLGGPDRSDELSTDRTDPCTITSSLDRRQVQHRLSLEELLLTSSPGEGEARMVSERHPAPQHPASAAGTRPTLASLDSSLDPPVGLNRGASVASGTYTDATEDFLSARGSHGQMEESDKDQFGFRSCRNRSEVEQQPSNTYLHPLSRSEAMIAPAEGILTTDPSTDSGSSLPMPWQWTSVEGFSPAQSSSATPHVGGRKQQQIVSSTAEPSPPPRAASLRGLRDRFSIGNRSYSKNRKMLAIGSQGSAPATPVNREASGVDQENGISAATLRLHDLGRGLGLGLSQSTNSLLQDIIDASGSPTDSVNTPLRTPTLFADSKDSPVGAREGDGGRTLRVMPSDLSTVTSQDPHDWSVDRREAFRRWLEAEGRGRGYFSQEQSGSS